jgi:Flp pilus assembly protein TadG
MRLLGRFLKAEHGGALLELAVAVPIMLLLAVGAADYARVYYSGVTVANAAFAGAFYGVTTMNGSVPDSMIWAAQQEAAPVTLDSVSAGQFCRCPSTGLVSCTLGTCTDGYGVPQTYDSVWVKKNVPMMIRYLGLPSTVSVGRKAIVREN